MDIFRLMDLAGAAAAARESVDEASGGSGTSVASAITAVVFNRFRRRCGGSSACFKSLSMASSCGVAATGCSSTLFLATLTALLSSSPP